MIHLEYAESDKLRICSINSFCLPSLTIFAIFPADPANVSSILPSPCRLVWR